MRQRCTEQVLDVRYWGAGEGGGAPGKAPSQRMVEKGGGGRGGGVQGHAMRECPAAGAIHTYLINNHNPPPLGKLAKQALEHWGAGRPAACSLAKVAPCAGVHGWERGVGGLNGLPAALQLTLRAV